MSDSYNITAEPELGKADEGVKLVGVTKLEPEEMADTGEALQQDTSEPKQEPCPVENGQAEDNKAEETPPTVEPASEENKEVVVQPVVVEEQPATEEQPQAEEEKEEEEKKEEEKKERPPPVSISGSQLRQLVIGSALLKAKKGPKTIPRLFNITNDLVRLTWNTKRKPQAKAQIPLSQIQEVLQGRTTDSFRLHNSPSLDDQCCFSVVYVEGGSHTKILDLIAPTPEEATLWVNGLLALTCAGVSTSTNEVRKKWLRSLFDEADVNGDGTLDLKEVIQMMKKLNVGISNKVIRKKFKEADTSGTEDNKLDFDEFANLFRDLSDRPEMRKLFNLYASSDQGDYMSVGDLTSFLTNVQNVPEVTTEYCESIIDRFEPSEEGRNKYLLSLDGFIQYMLSDENDIFIRAHRSVYQDMEQPLSHYFIASSHNTYLLEDQLSGPSSVDAYINALKKGCRCVELDCWDGEDDEPVIYHGHTLTSKILFKDVITAIKEHAFTVSPYPVILSIENHCSVKQQAVMAQYMIDIFGDKLYKAPRDHDRRVLPSPEELKHKILIKAKKLPTEQEDKSDDEGEVSDEDEAAEIDPEEIKKVRPVSPSATTDDPPEEPPAAEGGEVRKVINSAETRRRASTRKKRPEPIVVKPSAKRKLSSKLSKCVNYVQSVHFKGFEHTPNVPFYQMSSFGESAATKSSEELAAHFIEYNKNHLSRTYPSGRRVDSSNYEPINMWNAGCQIVALNYQTSGKAMDWNIGKFQQNGGAGYILKPEIMRQDFAYFDHMERTGPSGISPKVVTLRIISGQQLPKPEGGSETGEVIDPYVQVQFAGVPIDSTQFKTKVISDNGFNPVWNESFTHTVHFPELTMVRFKVMDYDLLTKDDFIGQFTLPFSSIETGYRHVHLYDSDWKRIENATLFVEVTSHDLIGPPPKSKERLRETTLKKARQYHSMKPCSFVPVDTQLKTVSGNLKVGIDFKEDFTFSVRLFKESCGKPPQANLTECFEVLFQRASVGQITLRLVPRPTSNGGHTVYQLEATPTKTTLTLARMMSTFDRLNAQMFTLFNMSPMIVSELESKLEAVRNLKTEFNDAVKAFPPKKAEQAKSAYSYNVRTLQNEVAQLKAAVSNATDILSKIPALAEKFSVEIKELPQPETTKVQAEPVTTEGNDDQKEEIAPKEESPKDEEVAPNQDDTQTEEKVEAEVTPKEEEVVPQKEEVTEEVTPKEEEVKDVTPEVVPKEEEEATPKVEEVKEEETPKEDTPVKEEATQEEEAPKEATPEVTQEEETPKEDTPVEEEVAQKEETPKEDTPVEEEATQEEEVPKEKEPTVKVSEEWDIITTDEIDV